MLVQVWEKDNCYISIYCKGGLNGHGNGNRRDSSLSTSSDNNDDECRTIVDATNTASETSTASTPSRNDSLSSDGTEKQNLNHLPKSSSVPRASEGQSEKPQRTSSPSAPSSAEGASQKSSKAKISSKSKRKEILHLVILMLM